MTYLRELELAGHLVQGCNGIIVNQYHNGKSLRVSKKGDGSNVTPLDQDVSDYVVAEAGRHGKDVLSEEAGSSATPGQNGIYILDPVDGTDDMIAGQRRDGQVSIAGPSLGYWDNELVVGAVSFPLLGKGVPPATFTACKGQGAARYHYGKTTGLKVDAAPTRGIVLMTVKQTATAWRHAGLLRAKGYTPVPADGAIFKACALVDPYLRQFYPDYRALGLHSLPVVGFISTGVHLHDVAATTCIVREAGGVTTLPLNRTGKQVWAAANNRQVYNELMKVITA